MPSQHLTILTIYNEKSSIPLFQSCPKQFATGNLHRPKKFDGILPNQIATLFSPELLFLMSNANQC